MITRRASKYSSQDIHDVLFSVTPHPHDIDEMDKEIAAHLRRKHERR